MNVAGEMSDDSLSALTLLTPLGSRQVALLGVLTRKNHTLGAMYVGALMARSTESNPDHISQACHSLRELIDNLPKYFDVPVESAGRLGDQVNWLHDKWKKEPRVRNLDSTPVTEKFAIALERFFVWKDENLPKRREVARRTIRDLAIVKRPLPKPIEDLRADEWIAIRDFFVQSTHHKNCSIEEFDVWLGVFEDFMINLAAPKTFENADAIDLLIREGEANG